MYKYLIGAAAGALVALTPAVAENMKPNHGMKDRTQARSDVQGHATSMFSRLDSNKDGFVTTAEIDSMTAKRAERRQEMMAKKAASFDPAKAFARLDTNKDGKLAMAEVEAVRAARKPDGKAGGKSGGKLGGRGAERLFARADSNRDGFVTLAEFQAAPKPARDKAAMARRGGGMTRMLGAADVNKDGKVSLAEVQEAALSRFDRADANRDGKVTPDERKAMRKAMRAPG